MASKAEQISPFPFHLISVWFVSGATTMALKMSIAGLFSFSVSIILASATLGADVDLCRVGKISGENFTLSLNFSEENAMKNGGECSRIVLLESARVKLVVEELNLASGAAFEIYDGPGPNKGQHLGPNKDSKLPSTYISSGNALFIVFKDGQGGKEPSSFRGKITPEPYQNTCHCRGVANGKLECSENDHERRCKVKCQPSHMYLSINKNVKCDLVKGEWDIDIHNTRLACQKVQSPLQIKATVHFNYANATCLDIDSDKVKSAFREFIRQNSDIQTKGVCFGSGGDENVDCKGKRLLVNCSGDKPAKMTVTVTDRITEPPTLKEANLKLQELLTAYENLKLANISDSGDLVMKKENTSFTADKGSVSVKITPFCSGRQDYVKVPGNETSFVCSTCPLHHVYNATTHMCQKCPTGSSASEGATSCTKNNSTVTMTPIKTSCSNACMKGKHVDARSWMCEWCPLATYQNSSMTLNPRCIPCPDQKKTSFPGAQSVEECRDPCQSGTFYNTSGAACQDCPIGSYMDVDKHAFTKCKTCAVGKTTKTTGNKKSNDCYSRCTPGQFYNLQSNMCTPCANGKYQDKMDQDSCVDCPVGKTTINPGSKSSAECVILCGPGTFLSDSTGKCEDCPMNTYQDLDQYQSNKCKPCGPNKNTNATGQSNISQCFDSCSKGWFLAKSASLCRKCPKGEYQDQPGQEQCKKCPDGKSTEKEGRDDPKACITIAKENKFETIKMSLRFKSLLWSEELKDKDSVKYQETKKVIEEAIKFEFRYDRSFQAVEVTNLRSGSVIAEFDVHFNDKADYEPIKVLQDAVDKGKVGSLPVSPESFRILHQACGQPLGMENGQIKDDQITASTYVQHYEPHEARLNAKGGRGWHARYTKSTEYLQIDFRREVNITGVATQGESTGGSYVTEYKLSMSEDGKTWNEYTENNKSKV